MLGFPNTWSMRLWGEKKKNSDRHQAYMRKLRTIGLFCGRSPTRTLPQEGEGTGVGKFVSFV